MDELLNLATAMQQAALDVQRAQIDAANRSLDAVEDVWSAAVEGQQHMQEQLREAQARQASYLHGMIEFWGGGR